MIKTGAVYFIPNCTVSNPIKDKYAICVSADDNLWFLINSCDERRPYHHELDDVVYLETHEINCLKHRSYINIKNIRMLSDIDKENFSFKCLLQNDLWLKIKTAVKRNKTLQRKYKQIIDEQTKYK